jgi:hypothetical protein
MHAILQAGLTPESIDLAVIRRIADEWELDSAAFWDLAQEGFQQCIRDPTMTGGQKDVYFLSCLIATPNPFRARRRIWRGRGRALVMGGAC